MLGKLLDLRKEVKVESIVITRSNNTVVVNINVETEEQAKKLEKELNELVKLYRWLL
ncbi:MAG: hypothetical protein QXM79_07245 [Zestosphaera sp.]